ncbi:MAG: LON peptidase substrate-binding domain-containing protein, partial [Burkholderiales bacterium]
MDALILIPMRNAVLFPGVISPVAVGRSASIAAANEAVRQSRKVGFVLQRDAKTDAIGPNDLHWVGTAGEIVRYVPSSEGPHHLAVQGQERFRIAEFLEGWPFLVARVVWVPEATGTGEEVEARFLQLKTQAAEAIKLLPNVPDELVGAVQAIDSASQLADMVSNLLDIENAQKQAILEAFDLKTRLDMVLEHLAGRVGVLRLSKEIGDKTRKEFDERQREHVLREQMRQ